MAFFDFLFGSGQGGGKTTPPPASPATPSGEGSSVMDILNAKPAPQIPLLAPKKIAPLPQPIKKSSQGSSLSSLPSLQPAPVVKEQMTRLRQKEDFTKDSNGLKHLISTEAHGSGDKDQIAEAIVHASHTAPTAGQSLPGPLGIMSQTGEGVISGGEDLLGGVLGLTGLEDSSNPFKNATDQQKNATMRTWLQKYAPDRLPEFESNLALKGYSKGAENTGRVAEALVEGIATAGPISRAVRAVPAIVKMRQAGKAGVYAANIIENLAASIGTNTEYGVTRGQNSTQIAQSIAANPSVVLPFASKWELVGGFAADVMAARAMGYTPEEALMNGALALGGNVGTVFGVGSEVRGLGQKVAIPSYLSKAAKAETENIHAFAMSSSPTPEHAKAVFKMQGEAEKRLLKLHKDFTAQQSGAGTGERRTIGNKGQGAKPERTQPDSGPRREAIEKELSDLQQEMQTRQQHVAEAPDFSKYRTKKEGEFPNVTGEVSKNSKPTFADEFKQRGDQIAQEHGFATVEDLLSHQKNLDISKERVKELKTQMQKLKAEQATLPAPLEDALPKKKFLQTVKEADTTSTLLKEDIAELAPQTYEPVTNAESMKTADAMVKQSPETAREYLSNDAPPSAEKGAIAVRLAKHYEEQARAAGIAKNDVEMNRYRDQAVEVIETYDQQLREAGRFVQAASMWSNMTPEGMLRKATREIEKANMEKGYLKKLFKTKDLELTPEDKRAILRDMGEAGKLPAGSKAREDAVWGVMQKIADKIPISASEMFDSYRYQNMLSGPQTQLRNIYSNLFQTYVTRPAHLAVGSGVDWIKSTLTGKEREIYARDVGKYAKGVWNSQIDAMHAAAEAFAMKNPSGRIDSSSKLSSSIQSLRQKNMPKALTVTSRMLEAADKYFSALIAGGETARLQGRGMSQMEIQTKANKLAEESLFRGKLTDDPDAPILSRALTSIGQNIIDLRKKPVIGKPISWFVPFVTTPVRVGKFAVESSPLGFVGGNYSTDQLTKATIGSLITMGGGWLAMNNKTTWEAPKDKDAKEAFYASGRKPYSVLIGGKWVPMWYFGPYAFALAIPAAIKHHEADSKTKLTDGQLAKIGAITGNLAQFLGSQSPLQGMTGFFRLMQGDTDYTTASNLGFTAGQVIPLQGLLRYVNKAIDPVYRKGTTFSGAIESGLPGFSKKLPAYENQKGEVQKRDSTSLLLPYDLGTKDDTFEKAYQKLIKESQKNTFDNKKKSIRKDKSLTSSQRSAKVRNLEAGGGVFDGVPILDTLFSGEGTDTESQLPAFNPP